MAVYDSLPPEATRGRKVKTPRQKRTEIETPRMKQAKIARPLSEPENSEYTSKGRKPTKTNNTEKPTKTTKTELAEKKTKGFENNAQKIAKDQGISLERARAILAVGARKASPAAKRANPALKKVKGAAKKY